MSIERYLRLCERVIAHCRDHQWYGPDTLPPTNEDMVYEDGVLAFSPDSQWLISSKDNGMVDLFSLKSFTLETSFAAHTGLFTDAMDPIGGLDWSKTGYIATGGASVFEKDMKKTDYSIKLWKIEEVSVG